MVGSDARCHRKDIRLALSVADVSPSVIVCGSDSSLIFSRNTLQLQHRADHSLHRSTSLCSQVKYLLT